MRFETEVVGEDAPGLEHRGQDVAPEVVVRLLGSASCASSSTSGAGREDVVAHRAQAVLGVAGDRDRVLLGLLLEADDRAPRSSTCTMPNWRRLATLDRQAGDGRDRRLLAVEVHHLPDVHLVDVVGAEHQDRVGAVLLDQVEVLVDRVGSAAVPVLAHAHLRGHDGRRTNRACRARPRCAACARRATATCTGSARRWSGCPS